LIDAHEDYSRKTQTIAVIAGTETYALPSDYYKTTKVFALDGERRYSVPRFTLDAIDGYKVGALRNGTIEHWYAERFTPLSGESDTVNVNFMPGWEDYVALFAATRAALRERVDHRAFAAERDAVLARIMELIEPRDAVCVPIGDTNRTNQVMYRLYGFTRRYRYRVMGNNIHIVEAEVLGV
jgi:hypothetical protein